MVYLQDADNTSRLFALDCGGVRRLSAARSRFLKKTVARNVSGHLGHVADKPAALYVAGGRLWLAIDSQPWFLDELSAVVDEADDGYSVHISTPKRNYDFLVDADTLDSDTNPFTAAEDDSFGLWVARLIQNRERQNVLLDVLVDASLDEVPEHATSDRPSGPVNIRHSWDQSSQATGLDPNRTHSTE